MRRWLMSLRLRRRVERVSSDGLWVYVRGAGWITPSDVHRNMHRRALS